MSYADNYNFIERLLHYIAFSVPSLQRILCELENDVYKQKLEYITSRNEVFVTGLPRAGTTLLLELLYATGEFKTFTYRHMPFILTPLFWQKFSQGFQKQGDEKERAHGDGMKVSYDSPEAFEEIIWLAYLEQEIIDNQTLNPLSNNERTAEFSNILKQAIKKVLLLDGHSHRYEHEMRYLSKNNANISRIEFITNAFPSSTILVIYRNPLSQVTSLIKQHARFTHEHKQNRFSKRYMRWLGHYEFGLNFKPINFDGWLDNRTIPDDPDINFWLQYWTAAYAFALAHKTENVYFVNYDELLLDGKTCLKFMADKLDLEDKQSLIKSAIQLRAPTTKPVIGCQECSQTVLTSAEAVYQQLKAATHIL